jgi:Rieske Fe-S protein
MDRNEFIRKCSLACAGGGLFTLLLQRCEAAKIVTAVLADSELVLPESEFEFLKKDQLQFRHYVVVQNDQLQYPVCIYRFSKDQYTALWMRCTHQGTELQVFGDRLHCPAHGSEFNNRGGVENGPAADALRTFPVAAVDGKIKISLK